MSADRVVWVDQWKAVEATYHDEVERKWKGRSGKEAETKPVVALVSLQLGKITGFSLVICFCFFHRWYHAWKYITLHFGWQWLLLLPPAMLPCNTGGKRKDVTTYLENVSHPNLCTCQNKKNIFSKCKTYFFGLCMKPPPPSILSVSTPPSSDAILQNAH